MAALGIGGELHLVHGQEIDLDVARHGLDGAHVIARIVGLDLFLAGDQRHVAGANLGDDLVVDLARQKPQRQPDKPALVAEHALDGEMGLAGVGRSQAPR